MIYHPRVLQLHTSKQLRAELERVGAEPSITAREEQLERGTLRVVKLRGVMLALARLLYQELVMEGGQVVTANKLDHVGPGETDVLLLGTRYQFEHLIIRLRWQSSDELELLADELELALERFDRPSPPPLVLGEHTLDWGTHTHIMGIVNVTPNSFSGDGLIRATDRGTEFVARAVAYAEGLVAHGADLLDIGGESTHPRAEPVDAATEIARVVPVIQALAGRVAVPLSVDTYKAEVARAALASGARIVNDVWGLRRDPDIKHVAAASGAAVVITHNRLDPTSQPLSLETKGKQRKGDGVGERSSAASDTWFDDIISELRAQVETAVDAGIPEARIIIDPGLGFGKTVTQNLELLNRLGELRVLGLPILIGPSRKGFIRRVLGVEHEEAEAGTSAAVALGIARGAHVVRVHNVAQLAQVARMTDAVIR